MNKQEINAILSMAGQIAGAMARSMYAPAQQVQQAQQLQQAQQVQPIMNYETLPPTQFPAQQTQPIQLAQQTQPIQLAQQTQPIQLAQQTQPIQLAQQTQPIQLAQQTQPIQQAQQAQQAQLTQQAQQTQQIQQTQQTQQSIDNLSALLGALQKYDMPNDSDIYSTLGSVLTSYYGEDGETNESIRY